MSRTAVIVTFLVAVCRSAAAAPKHVYVLAIGNNSSAPTREGPNGTNGQTLEQEPLHYADDDAAAFFEFTEPFAKMGVLLVDMDADTRRRFPTEAAIARPATIAQLRAAVGGLRAAVLQDQANGVQASVLIFYSGHGARSAGEAHLVLRDAALTRDLLYDEVLAALPAQYIHLFVDACYAEAVVRPRDVDASVVQLGPDLLNQYENTRTLTRFPNVGAVIASTGASQTHEWDVYGHGVFTEELLSGLRGAADVNGDGRIEYSELQAFLAAANREVKDVRARLAVVIRPPTADQHTAIVDLAALGAQSRLSGIPGSAGHIFLEDHFGNRLADLHGEIGSAVSLVLPPGRVIYLHGRHGEAQISLHPGETVMFSQLTLSESSARARGAMGDAMAMGLFASPFGPSYYRGFVDEASEVVPVEFRDPVDTRVLALPSQETVAQQGAGPGGTSFGRDRVVVLQTGAEMAVGRDVGPLLALRAGYRPAGLTHANFSVDLGRGASQAYSEWRSVVSADYRVTIALGHNLVSSLGAQLGAGVAWQNPRGLPVQATLLGTVGPRGELTYVLYGHTAIELSLGAPIFLFRRDGQLASSLLPEVFFGVAGRV